MLPLYRWCWAKHLQTRELSSRLISTRRGESLTLWLFIHCSLLFAGHFSIADSIPRGLFDIGPRRRIFNDGLILLVFVPVDPIGALIVLCQVLASWRDSSGCLLRPTRPTKDCVLERK
jgi:hypothetical protein